ncbi:MAG: hypothetical protein IEMM0002_1505 [bacterium]|nr:MAG: hypothetical protein IEMM0002_1505 [bacterium]
MIGENKKPKMTKGTVGVLLFIIALAMYVSIIYKIKTAGP